MLQPRDGNLTVQRRAVPVTNAFHTSAAYLYPRDTAVHLLVADGEHTGLVATPRICMLCAAARVCWAMSRATVPLELKLTVRVTRCVPKTSPAVEFPSPAEQPHPDQQAQGKYRLTHR